MNWAKILWVLRRARAAYFKRVGLLPGIWFLFVVSFFTVVLLIVKVNDFRFNRLSAAEHLQLAISACGAKSANGNPNCASPIEARNQLAAIPAGAKEFEQSTLLRSAIERQEQQEALDDSRNQAAERQLKYQRYRANISGAANDPFTCSVSTESKPIVSFDGGTNWGPDDGRCQARMQKEKDSGAEMSSYWSNTLRVDTDMDSFWLPDEERVCQTYPNGEGKVSVVACNQTGNHRDHNIPVKFWGGTERNAVSNWKCRREKNLLSDEFVCRAID